MIEPVAEGQHVGKSFQKQNLQHPCCNLRDFTQNKHRKTDDTPFGGGAGMVMSAQPVFDALRSVNAGDKRILYMSPGAENLTAV